MTPFNLGVVTYVICGGMVKAANEVLEAHTDMSLVYIYNQRRSIESEEESDIASLSGRFSHD